MQSNLITRTALLVACGSLMHAQRPEAKELLSRALHLADLYNWADAAPAFTQAEQLFTAAGDRRNALYAKLGRIRSNIERDQQTLPIVSAQLAEALDDDPLLQNDKELRMFCLIVKGRHRYRDQHRSDAAGLGGSSVTRSGFGRREMAVSRTRPTRHCGVL